MFTLHVLFEVLTGFTIELCTESIPKTLPLHVDVLSLRLVLGGGKRDC